MIVKYEVYIDDECEWVETEKDIYTREDYIKRVIKQLLPETVKVKVIAQIPWELKKGDVVGDRYIIQEKLSK